MQLSVHGHADGEIFWFSSVISSLFIFNCNNNKTGKFKSFVMVHRKDFVHDINRYSLLMQRSLIIKKFPPLMSILFELEKNSNSNKILINDWFLVMISNVVI